MGLDIYGHLVKQSRERGEDESFRDYINYLCEENDKECLEAAKQEIAEISDTLHKTEKKGALAPYMLQDADEQMKKYFTYDFQREALKTAKTAKDFDKWANGIDWDRFYAPSDVYFRKVNFIYAYFSNKGLEDECCWVKKEDIADIMQRCVKVLYAKDEETSKELLPTQSGFFFGSTDYDDWYYGDVADVLDKFNGLLLKWPKDRELCMIMSW